MKYASFLINYLFISVNFGVDEVIQEYASIMANHFQNILSFCEENHWRSNPSILVGLRIAVVQRNKDSIPMISTGTVIKSDEQNIAIKLDNENSTTSTLNSACLVSDMGFLNSPTRLNAFSSSTKNLLSPFGNISGHTFSSTSGTSTPTSKASSMIKFPGNDETKIIFHPHSSIFWVQDLNVNQASDAVTLNVESNINGSWLTPDEIFAKLAKTTITYDQKKMFWEMLSVINQFSEFTKYMKSGPNSPEYIGKLLSQPEFKVLWLNEENIDFIPKKVMIDLIKSAYLD